MHYFNKKNNFLHGIMFHHFHDRTKHIESQGSINSKDFTKIIKFIGRKNILNADDFLKEKNRNTKSKKVCFTFDDGLKSQIDVALPILKKFKIKGVFFVYSSIFTNKPNLLEVYRYFRTKYFKNVNSFYELFFKLIGENKIKNFIKFKKREIKKKKKAFPFYTINDIKFRLVRDELLSDREYNQIFKKMFKLSKFNPRKVYKKLFLSKKDLKTISDAGHMVGLHSHSHPTQFSKLSLIQQKKELKINHSFIKRITNKKVKCISYPCGDYNIHTLRILRNMSIKFGFKQVLNNRSKYIKSLLEIPREDHSNIMKRIS